MPERPGFEIPPRAIPADDDGYFEQMTRAVFQAGFSWQVVNDKWPNFQKAFDGFDVEMIARYGARKRRALLSDAGIVRNRLKIESTIGNARAFLHVVDEYGSFSRYLWDFVDGKPIVNRWHTLADVPVSTERSDALSKALKKRGFKFVGTTICYSFMQAVGLVNDHTTDCFQIARAHV